MRRLLHERVINFRTSRDQLTSIPKTMQPQCDSNYPNATNCCFTRIFTAQ